MYSNKLSCKHLEICLPLFLLPILNYGVILYDDCSEMEKLKLENVLLAATQVVVGIKKKGNKSSGNRLDSVALDIDVNVDLLIRGSQQLSLALTNPILMYVTEYTEGTSRY